MNQPSINKKIIWFVEFCDFELDFIHKISSKLQNTHIKVASIKYWFFSPNIKNYDLIVVPFLPSIPSPNAKLIKSALKAGINVIVLNWWQSFSPSELEYRKPSIEYFSELPIYFVSSSKMFSEYLNDLGYKNNIIELDFHPSAICMKIEEERQHKQDVLFLIDFDYAFINEDLKRYRIKTGYDVDSLNERIKFSKDFLKIAAQEIIEFSIKNPNTNIKVNSYPRTCMNEVIEYFKLLMSSSKINISFKHKDIQDSILDCNVLITNIADMATYKNIISGNSLIYNPLEGPRDLKNFVEHNNYSIKHLNFKVDDIIQKKSQNHNKDNININQFSEAINILLRSNKKIDNKDMSELISVNISRLKIFKYNFKELFKFFIYSLFSKKNLVIDYFTPYSLNNFKIKKYKKSR